ncbi:MAG: hypothetical protein AB8G11_01950 [Saprospiraceae bacterium]
MKKVTLCLILLIAFIGCTKDVPVRENSKTQDDSLKKKILFNNNSENYQIEASSYQGRFQDKRNIKYSILISSYTNDLFESVQKQLIPFDVPKNYALTFYFDSDKFINENDFNVDDIKAISIFEEKNNHIFHRLVKKNNNNKFEEVSLLSCFAQISTNHMTDILLDVLEVENDGSYILFFNKDLTSKYRTLSNNRDYWRGSLKYYLRHSGLSKNVPGGNDDKTCETPCPYPQDNAACIPDIESEPMFFCVDLVPCKSEQVHDLYEESQDVKDNTLTLQKRFEVEFLSNSEFGKKYIEYYYLLSDEIPVNQISLSLANKILKLSSKVNTSIFYLLDSNNDVSNSNHIPITSEVKDLAIEVIEGFKLITNNQDLILVLDEVKQDFITYENKPFSYIIASCCN